MVMALPKSCGRRARPRWRWQERFGEEGMAGLWRDKTRPSRIPRPRLRTALVQLAWLWVRHQPDSALMRWFMARVEAR
jgi:hypothetical protein